MDREIIPVVANDEVRAAGGLPDQPGDAFQHRIAGIVPGSGSGLTQFVLRPEGTAAVVIADEERFLDRSQLRFFIVEDECKST